MEDKYYTPSLEEFYVGFECERYWGFIDPNGAEHSTWEKCVVEPSLWSSNQMWLLIKREDAKDFRVKYLDKEDIESLGFKTIIEGNRIIANKSKLIGDLEVGQWVIKYDRDKYKIQIESIGVYNDTTYWLQNITIKNKSELIKLLKQLGIDGSEV